MTSISSISRSFLLLMALSSVACGKKGETQQNYTIVKTEVDEVQRVAGVLLAESNRLLDGEFSGDPADRLAWEEARERRDWEHVLFLPHLKTLNEVQAEAIAENASWVYLNGLTSITPQIAQKMFSKGYMFTYISLNGLEEISPETAVYMGNVSRHVLPGNSLVLNGLKEITPDVAQSLMGEEGGGYIHLGGVTSISDEVIRIISREHSDIRKRVVRFHMPNLELTQEIAKDLPGTTLFSVIEKEELLSDTLAEMIAQNGFQYIYLDNLKEIQASHLSTILRQERTSISLDGITSLKKGVAKELARVSPTYVSLDGLVSLSEEDIDVLIQSDIEELSLKGLNKKEYKKLNKSFRTSDKYISFKDE